MKPSSEISKQLTEGFERLAKQGNEDHAQNIEMHHRTQQQLTALQSFIEAQVPTLIEFPNEKVAEDFKTAAAEAKLDLGEVTFAGPIVRFTRRLREMPETPAILFGLLAEFAGIPGGFSLGFAGGLAGYRAKGGK